MHDECRQLLSLAGEDLSIFEAIDPYMVQSIDHEEE